MSSYYDNIDEAPLTASMYIQLYIFVTIYFSVMSATALLLLLIVSKVHSDNNHSATSKRRRPASGTGLYSPIILNASDCRSKRMKYMKQKRAASAGTN